MKYFLMILFGLLSGFFGGYTGIAGGPILVALSVIFTGYSQHEAQGIILAVMLGPMTITGLIAMKDRIKKLLPYALISVVSYALFSYFGAFFAFLINDKYLKICFGLLLIIIGIIEIILLFNNKILRNKFRCILFQEEKFYPLSSPKQASRYSRGWNKKEEKQTVKKDIVVGNSLIPFNYLSMTVLSIIVGIIGGLFGLGGGIIMIPVMTRLMKVHKDDARTLSLMILLPPVSTGAVIKYQMQGSIDWKVVLIVFTAYIIMNYFGSILGRKHSEKNFKVIFSIVMIILGLSYFLLEFFSS